MLSKQESLLVQEKRNEEKVTRRDFIKKGAILTAGAYALLTGLDAVAPREARADWIKLINDNHNDGIVPYVGGGRYVQTLRNGSPVDFSTLGWTEVNNPGGEGLLTMVGPDDGTLDFYATQEYSGELRITGDFLAVEPARLGGVGVQMGSNDQSKYVRLAIYKDPSLNPVILFFEHIDPTTNTSLGTISYDVTKDAILRITKQEDGTAIGEAKIGDNDWQQIGNPSSMLESIASSAGVIAGHRGLVNYKITGLLVQELQNSGIEDWRAY